MPNRSNINLVETFQKAYRSAASHQGYSCICGEHYTSAVKLWAHAKLAHPAHPDIINLEDEPETRRRFLDQAQQWAISNKAISDPPSKGTIYRTSTNRNLGRIRRSEQNLLKSSQGNQGHKTRHHELPNTTSREDELTKEKDSLIKNERGGLGGPSDLRSGQLSIGNNKAIIQDVGGQQHALDKDFPREHSGPKQPLYDPYFGKDHEESSGRARFRARPLLESSPHGRLDSVNMEERQPEQNLSHGRSFMQHTYDSLVLEQDRRTSPGSSPPMDDWAAEMLNAEPEMLLQPETRPISHNQLVIEVKGIYAGLVMVEAKCIDIDEKQTAAAREKDLSKKVQLKNDQWQSLIALHKQLLREHHDFFLAPQHPAASPTLSRLAAKYNMPARMWRHGIHAFLDVLRYRLPDSLEHMLAFIYIAYSMMALLYETVPTFEDAWIECLGDLGRYGMAIEDDEPRDRETWSNVAKFWYNKATDKNPTVGRLYHHLAILARPYSLEQLSLYTRALTCVTPFESARGRVLTLFRPLLSARHTTGPQSSPLESAFIKANTDTQDESSTEHQLSNTFADLLMSALDQISHWRLRLTSFGKALGSFRLSSVGAAYKIRSSVALTLPICTTARTIPRNAGNEESTGSLTAAMIPLAHWPYLAFVIITLLGAQHLAHMKDPIFVWGCMMTIWAFGWWTIRADSNTSLQISGVVLFLWAISAYQYGHAAFSKHRIPTRAGVIIIISAMILDVSTVTLMTPSEASTAQPELLLSLSLPLVSLILAAIVNVVAAMQSTEQIPALEAGLHVHVPAELPTTPSEGG